MFIQAAISALEEHLVLGSLLASLVIFFFLANIRATFIAAIAIPTSIISTFALISAMGYTLNQLTMLALTLMVGVVVDDAIIVLENIYRFVEEKGMLPFDAAIDGTKEIGLAVMATTLSLMAVFVPVGFMGGIVGRFMASFGLTAAFAVGVSLLVSFTLTPMLSSRFIKTKKVDEAGGHGSKDSIVFRPIDRVYSAMLRWSMAHRGVVVVICVLVIASIVPLFQMIGKSFVPNEDRSEFQVAVRAPEGSGLTATTTILERIAADVAHPPGGHRHAHDGRRQRRRRIGPGGGSVAGGVNAGSIYVRLVPKNSRRTSQEDVMTRVRELISRYPGDLRASVQAAGGPGGGAGVQYSIAGPDLARLGGFSDALLAKLRATPEAVDADTSLVLGKPELRVEIDRQRAADLGVRVQDVAQALNMLVGGSTVSTFDVGNDQYDVRLRAAERFRTQHGGPGADDRRLEPARRRLAGRGRADRPVDRAVQHPAAQPGAAGHAVSERRRGQLTAGAHRAASSSSSTDLQLPSDYVAGPAGQSVELARTASSFIIAISLSFIFMYIVLAAQFESFLHPITILLTLPLAVPFGLLSLLIFGETVNIFSGLGLLLLFGIVKKNAILQIDHTNGLREKGLARYEAIMQANRDRLRPILMTTIALVAGMLPLVVSSGEGAATNRSIGVLVVGGQSLCLLLTLLAVPVFYSLFEDLREQPLWARIGIRRKALEAATVQPVTKAGSAVMPGFGSVGTMAEESE